MPTENRSRNTYRHTITAGRHALVPFPRQDDIGIVAEVCQSFVFDDGAFTVWKKGGQVDVDGYTRWMMTGIATQASTGR